MDSKEPVILGAYDSHVSILGLYSYPTGSGHTWVCDGYTSVQYSNGLSLCNFSMNWGWSGYYNGWYGFDDSGWNTPNGDYNYFPDMIYNIHP